jgi:hypothetical protein
VLEGTMVSALDDDAEQIIVRPGGLSRIGLQEPACGQPYLHS